MKIGLGQRLIDAGLVRAERAAALQQQGDLLEGLLALDFGSAGRLKCGVVHDGSSSSSVLAPGCQSGSRRT